MNHEASNSHPSGLFMNTVDPVKPTKSGPCQAKQEYTFSWNPLKCSFQTSQGQPPPSRSPLGVGARGR